MVWQLLDWWERTLFGHHRQEELLSLLMRVRLQDAAAPLGAAVPAMAVGAPPGQASLAYHGGLHPAGCPPLIGGCVPGPFGAWRFAARNACEWSKANLSRKEDLRCGSKVRLTSVVCSTSWSILATTSSTWSMIECLPWITQRWLCNASRWFVGGLHVGCSSSMGGSCVTGNHLFVRHFCHLSCVVLF